MYLFGEYGNSLKMRSLKLLPTIEDVFNELRSIRGSSPFYRSRPLDMFIHSKQDNFRVIHFSDIKTKGSIVTSNKLIKMYKQSKLV